MSLRTLNTAPNRLSPQFDGSVSGAVRVGDSVDASQRKLRVLALVPPDREGRRPSRYSFLTEELTQLATRVASVHVVSPWLPSPRMLDGIHGHPIPRWRSPGPSLRAVWGSYAWRHHWWNSSSVTERINVTRTNDAIAAVIRRFAIDIVYSPFLWPHGLAGIPAAERCGVPVVVSLRGADVLTHPGIGYGRTLDEECRTSAAATLKRANGIVCVSDALARRAIELGADPQRISVILKGVHLDRFQPGDAAAARLRLNLPARPTVLFVGHLIERKAPALLITAMRQLKLRIPDACAILCGDGPLLDGLRAHVRREHLEDDVIFAGRIARDVIPDYFRACDVFVLPSLAEGSGNVLVEAGACARPIVGSDVDGIPDYVEDGATGLLFRSEDARDLAHCLERLLGDAETAKRLGIAGRRRVERLHAYDMMIDSLVSLFETIVAQRVGAAQ